MARLPRVQIMETLLQVMARTQSGAGVHEEAMLAVGTFTVAVGSDFEKYLANFMPFIRAGLQDHTQWQVCLSTVGVLGDVCRAVGPAIWPYCDELVSVILANLGSPNIHRTIKPELLTVLGDMALAIEGAFYKYLGAVLTILHQAMAMSIQMVSTQGAKRGRPRLHELLTVPQIPSPEFQSQRGRCQVVIPVMKS
jgi:importin subunit beta-1